MREKRAPLIQSSFCLPVTMNGIENVSARESIPMFFPWSMFRKEPFSSDRTTRLCGPIPERFSWSAWERTAPCSVKRKQRRNGPSSWCGTLLRRILEQIGLDRINLIIPGDRERLDAMFDRIYELSRKETLANYRDACSECYALLLELSAQSTAMHRPPGAPAGAGIYS